MKILKFIIALVISFIPGVIGMLWTPSGGGGAWYASLMQPALTPPSWVFSVVWTSLYIMLGIALYLVIRAKNSWKTKILPIQLFTLHLILNGAWSYIFFGQHLITLGAIIIAALILLGFMMFKEFGHESKTARYLILPYIIWLFCALYLNMGILILN